VKGAEAEVINPPFFQFHEAANNINDINAAENLLYGGLGDHSERMNRQFNEIAALISENMVPYWLSRTELLLGDGPVEQAMGKHVLVVGLGGVGGICAEMIARAGIGEMTIIDGDKVDLSNCNRQIPALHSTQNRMKTAVMAERLMDINPSLKLHTLTEHIAADQILEILSAGKYDYVVDCIDTLSPKVQLMKICVDRGIPIVSALGAGGKTDPSKVRIAEIEDTHECNLARYVRKRLHKLGIRKGITVVFSPEKVDPERVIETEKAFPKKSLIGTISYMPAIVGCMCASVVIRSLYGIEQPKE
jgi:tRNA threonylcarbamoyladenosine dehydratase